MNRFILAMALAAVPSIAMAADLTAVAAPAAPSASWSGCYAGVGGSYVANSTSTLAFNTYDGGSHTAEGALFQVRSGCDIQSGVLVFGLYGTIDAGHLSGINTFFPVGPGFPEYLTTEVDWIGAVKARAGVAPTDQVLLFASAGLAFEHISYSDYDEVPVLSFEGFGDEVRRGYQVGVGAEVALGDSGRVYLEYAYSDFGSEEVTLYDTNPDTVTQDPWPNTYTLTTQAISLGYAVAF